MRILGVDYGEKRIGLAVSDPTGLIAQPLEVIAGGDPAAAARGIAEVAARYEAAEIIIGLPRNMNDTLGPKAEEALAFKALLENATDLDVATWDERLSTVRAERSLRETGWSRRKRQKRVDMVAAQVILQGYLDFLRKTRPSQEDAS
ncbi:MAG: Holliday junction resolvase RuvX [Planctomycetes bacterium]|nr:Holliday junction resolvase RuvX [Planctomycetota bacterium]